MAAAAGELRLCRMRCTVEAQLSGSRASVYMPEHCTSLLCAAVRKTRKCGRGAWCGQRCMCVCVRAAAQVRLRVPAVIPLLWMKGGPFAGTRTRRRRDGPSLRPRCNMRQRQTRDPAKRANAFANGFQTLQPSMASSLAPAASSCVGRTRAGIGLFEVRFPRVQLLDTTPQSLAR